MAEHSYLVHITIVLQAKEQAQLIVKKLNKVYCTTWRMKFKCVEPRLYICIDRYIHIYMYICACVYIHMFIYRYFYYFEDED